MMEKLKGYKLLLHKAYFDKGMGLTNYVKYMIAFFGIASSDARNTLIIGFVYAICCYFLGLWWYKSNLVLSEREISNQFDLFVKEMRQLSGAYIKTKSI